MAHSAAAARKAAAVGAQPDPSEHDELKSTKALAGFFMLTTFVALGFLMYERQDRAKCKIMSDLLQQAMCGRGSA